MHHFVKVKDSKVQIDLFAITVLSAESKGISSSYDDESQESKDDDATDCLSDRQLALGEQQVAIGDQHAKRYELYVPECTPDGRYQKVS